MGKGRGGASQGEVCCPIWGIRKAAVSERGAKPATLNPTPLCPPTKVSSFLPKREKHQWNKHLQMSGKQQEPNQVWQTYVQTQCDLTPE